MQIILEDHSTGYFLARGKLLGNENALKKKKIFYNDKIKRIDHFFNDLKVGMRNLIERVHEMGIL